MKTPHPHAEFLRAFADGGIDAVNEFDVKHRDWADWMSTIAAEFISPIVKRPADWKIRRKPRTIRIGDVEVVAGIAEAPAHHTEIWIADPTLDDCAVYDNWAGCSVDTWRLKHGIVHLTKEPAEAMGRALAALTEHKE